MHKAILMLLLAVVSSSAVAEWVEVDTLAAVLDLPPTLTLIPFASPATK